MAADHTGSTWRRQQPVRRAVVAGRLRDGRTCTLILQLEEPGRWMLYPHGSGQLAVELDPDEVDRLVAVVTAADTDGAAR